MTGLQAFQKVQKAATILAWGWMLKNLLGLISIGVLVYLIWWQWQLGLIGIVPLLVGILLINFLILPAVFGILNSPFAKMAKSGAVTLATLGVIDEDTVRKLADTKVEYWPKVIASSMTSQEFEVRMIAANEFDCEPETVLTEASKASVWIPWYFRQGALTLVTAPLFLFLVYCIAISAFGAVIQGLALLRASYAVFGCIGAIIVVSIGWVPVILPPILYYSLMKNLPGLWLRPDASRLAKVSFSLAVIVLLPLAAYLIYHAVTWGITWIADQDPCAAFSAGVTGSKPMLKSP